MIIGDWTADGWLWKSNGSGVPSEEALEWYPDEREHPEYIDLGGEAYQ